MNQQNATAVIAAAGHHMTHNPLALWVVGSFMVGMFIGVFACFAAAIN